MTRVAVVLGWPVSHSKSPAMHDAAFAALDIDAKMIAIGVPPEGLVDELARLRSLPMLGASITVPHKVTVVSSCDELSDDARAIGAVNCLELAGERLVGHNTDGPGFRDALIAAHFSPADAFAVLLGAGGAARAVGHALHGAGARVQVVARKATATTRPWSELPELFARADLVVDCTPTGLEPETDAVFAEALPLAQLRAHALVATLVYHRRTRLLDLAATRGHQTLDGRGMLIHQAAHAFALWTRQAAPLEVMARAFDAT